jgi:virginiamycin A acetyltransferase
LLAKDCSDTIKLVASVEDSCGYRSVQKDPGMPHFIHPTASISRLADLEDSTRGSRLEIGEDVVVDAFVKMKFAGGTGDIRVGPRCYINSGVVIYSGNGVTLGTGVLIAANSTLAATNHETRFRDRLIRDQGFAPSKGGILIEDDVWIGANCAILDGAVIRRGAVIAAGSCVRGHVEAYAIMAGSPLRQIGTRAE